MTQNWFNKILRNANIFVPKSSIWKITKFHTLKNTPELQNDDAKLVKVTANNRANTDFLLTLGQELHPHTAHIKIYMYIDTHAHHCICPL